MGGSESRGMCCMKSAQSLSAPQSSRRGSRLIAKADPSSMPSTYAVTSWRKDESLSCKNAASIISLRSQKSKTKGSKSSKRSSMNVCTESMNGSQQLTVDGGSLSELSLHGERGNPSINIDQMISDLSAFFNTKPYETTSQQAITANNNASPAFERAYIQSAEPSELTIYLRNEQSNTSKSKYCTLVTERVYQNVQSLQQFLDLGVPSLSFEAQDPFLEDQAENNNGIDSQSFLILSQSQSVQSQPSSSRNQMIQIKKQKTQWPRDEGNPSALPLQNNQKSSFSTPQAPQKSIQSIHQALPLQFSEPAQQLSLSQSHQFSAPLQTTSNIIPLNSSSNINSLHKTNEQSKILYSWGDLSTKGMVVQVIRSFFQRQHFSKPREVTYIKVMKSIDENTCLIACQSSDTKQSNSSVLEESDSLNHTAQQQQQLSRSISPHKRSVRKTSGSQISSGSQNEDKTEKAQLFLSGMLISYNTEAKELKLVEMSALDLHIDISHYVQRQLIIHRQKKQFVTLQTALAK